MLRYFVFCSIFYKYVYTVNPIIVAMIYFLLIFANHLLHKLKKKTQTFCFFYIKNIQKKYMYIETPLWHTHKFAR